MNIEIANRLVDLRKKSGLSQEELAAKLGLSRQAVSKWERAEASPDTDNLICLAKIYGVSLDDLLNTEQSVDEIVEEQVKPAEEEKSEAASSQKDTTAGESKTEDKKDAGASEEKSGAETKKSGDGIHIDGTGVHFKDGEDEGSIDGSGVHITSADGSFVHIDGTGVHVRDSDGNSKSGVRMSFNSVDPKRKRAFNTAQSIVSSIVSVLCVTAYLLCGFLISNPYYGWGCSWIVFFLIPLSSSFVEALRNRKFTTFAFPVLVTAVYLSLGMVWGMWHPWWALFFSIPVYYVIFDPIDKAIRNAHRGEGSSFSFKSEDKDDDDDDDDDVIDIDVK